MAIPTELPVKHKCGHTEKKDFSDVPAGKRKSRAKWWSENRDCFRCWKQSQDQDKEQQLRQRLLDAEQFQQSYELPELEGSEAQIKWATLIRAERLEELVAEDSDQKHRQDEILEATKQIVWAGWWLDNLHWKDVKEQGYGPEEFAELILTGPAAQQQREENQIQTENPHDWDGTE